MSRGSLSGWGSLSRGSMSFGGVVCPVGVSVQGVSERPPCTVTSGRYAS